MSKLARELFSELLDQLRDVNARLDGLDTRILAICRNNAPCRRLARLPGVGPIIATALISAIDDGRHFRNGRELAAWIGGAAAIHDRRQAAARRNRHSRKSLSPATDDPWRSCRDQSPGAP